MKMNKIDEKAAELSEQLKAELGEIELKVTTGYTLADAIREGSTVSEHDQSGWGNGETACALTAGVIAAKARKYL
jgi:hypothetical protein